MFYKFLADEKKKNMRLSGKMDISKLPVSVGLAHSNRHKPNRQAASIPVLF